MAEEEPGLEAELRRTTSTTSDLKLRLARLQENKSSLAAQVEALIAEKSELGSEHFCKKKELLYAYRQLLLDQLS